MQDEFSDATKPQRITDAMFIEAARASADQVGPESRHMGMLFPSQADILNTEITTAVRVAGFIFDQGLAGVTRPAEIRPWIEAMLYRPEYRCDF